MSPGQYVPQEVRAKCLPAGQGKMSPKIETREKSGQFVPQGNMSSGQFVPQPSFFYRFFFIWGLPLADCLTEKYTHSNLFENPLLFSVDIDQLFDNKTFSKTTFAECYLKMLWENFQINHKRKIAFVFKNKSFVAKVAVSSFFKTSMIPICYFQYIESGWEEWFKWNK